MNRFISIYFSVLAFTFIFSLCLFIPAFSNYGSIVAFNPSNSNFYLDILDSNLIWPTPRFYHYYFWFWL